MDLTLDKLKEASFNPRKHYRNMVELTESVRKHGVIAPLLVRLPAGSSQWEILGGHRRFRAAKAANVITVPVQVIENVDDKTAIELCMLDNLHNEQPHPLDEAVGLNAMVQQGSTVSYLADRLDKSESYIYNRLRLITLSEAWQEKFFCDALGVKAGMMLARLQPDQQGKAYEKFFDADAVGDNALWEQDPSPRNVEQWIEGNTARLLSEVHFKLADKDLVPAAGACTKCPKRSEAAGMLFEEIAKDDRCLDPECMRGKVLAHVDREIKRRPELVELSTTYETKTRERGLAPTNWMRVDEADKCGHSVTGMVVEGYQGVGEVPTVCLRESGCPTHFPKTGGGYDGSQSSWDKQQKAESVKRKRELIVRARIVDELLPKVIRKLTPGNHPYDKDQVFAILAAGATEAIAYTPWETFLDRHGWSVPKESREIVNRLDYLKGKVTEGEWGAIAIELVLLTFADVSQYGQNSTELIVWAEDFDIKVKRIRAQVAAESKPRKKATKKSTKKATKGAK